MADCSEFNGWVRRSKGVTDIISKVLQVYLMKHKGGKGKKAPYETVVMRIPTPIEPEVRRLIEEFFSKGVTGIEGKGVTGIDDEGVTGIEGKGVTGIDDEGVTGIEGKGVTGIEGKGVTGIEGKGVTGIDDEGVTGIEGKGVTGIDDEGVTGIEGKGVTGIDDEGVTGLDEGVTGIEDKGVTGLDEGVTGIDSKGVTGFWDEEDLALYDNYLTTDNWGVLNKHGIRTLNQLREAKQSGSLRKCRFGKKTLERIDDLLFRSNL